LISNSEYDNHQALWFISSIILLDNPSNSKYVKLTTLFLEKPFMSIYEKAEKYYDLYKEDGLLYEDLNINMIKFNRKIYDDEVYKELIRRKLLIKKGTSVHTNFLLFYINVKIKYFVTNKTSLDLKEKVNDNKDKDFEMALFDMIAEVDYFDVSFFGEIVTLIFNLKLNCLKRLLTISNFKFSTVYTTWIGIVEDIKNIKLLCDKRDDCKSKSDFQAELNKILDTSIIGYDSKNSYEPILTDDTLKSISDLELDKLNKYIIFLKDSLANITEIENYIGTDARFPIKEEELNNMNTKKLQSS
jgi:hypothetical protein